ncbi:hypothetical protein L208DRAFT_1352741, partial [Tricholoma matsutake]
MIALCRAKCWIVQLSEQDFNLTFAQSQRGFHGNIIIYPQQPQRVATTLPPSVQEITSPICVIFVGSSPPSREWLREKAKPLAVRAHKVRDALIWLKAHNPLYTDIDINYNVLNSLPTNDLLPFHVEHVQSQLDDDVLTSRYDLASSTTSTVYQQPPPDADIAFQKVVISDIDGHASSNELRAAVLSHIQKKGGYLQISHEANPEIGGPEDPRCRERILFKRHLKHFLNLTDRRF